ncbi:hypothetical protein JOC78_003015 [Bacillus ectoiniformans]|uniref:DUF1189 domain-containing protein n=1 Tax=Bacillus ectoiniformans TaxID=1494429 RepID=UPI00195ABF0E|nr:DUF1189 domain-containing protein [Bacillus ectoiniformans]MBM7650031.1 hypothetical protein [Bacillus ectoiniformans]
MNIFQQLITSLYLPKKVAFYRFQGIGKTILYLFFLLFITSLPFIYHTGQLAAGGLASLREAISNDLPPFSIQNGELIAEHPETQTVHKDELDILFDPSGTITASEVKPDTFALLKNEAALAVNGEIQTFSYSFISNEDVKDTELLRFITSAQAYLLIIFPVLFFIYYLFISAAGFIKVTIVAVFGLLFKNLLNRKLNYSQSFRLGAYAITPSAILFTLLQLFGISIPLSFLADWIITLGFLYLVIKAVPAPKKKQPSAPLH